MALVSICRLSAPGRLYKMPRDRRSPNRWTVQMACFRVCTATSSFRAVLDPISVSRRHWRTRRSPGSWRKKKSLLAVCSSFIFTVDVDQRQHHSYIATTMVVSFHSRSCSHVRIQSQSLVVLPRALLGADVIITRWRGDVKRGTYPRTTSYEVR